MCSAFFKPVQTNKQAKIRLHFNTREHKNCIAFNFD